MHRELYLALACIALNLSSLFSNQFVITNQHPRTAAVIVMVRAFDHSSHKYFMMISQTVQEFSYSC